MNYFLARILLTVIIYVNMKSHHSPLETGGHSGNHVEDISNQQIFELHFSPLNARLERYWYTTQWDKASCWMYGCDGSPEHVCTLL